MRLALLLASFALAAHAADTRYYLVEGTMTLPDGRRAGTTLSLVKRSVDREAKRIEETVLSLRGEEPAREFVTVITPGAGKAAISSPAAGMSGEATLTGPEWAWTGMKFTTRLDSGGQVDGDDEFGVDGMTAHKKMFTGEGRIQIAIEESGKSISEAVYRILRARLLPK
jgi:hypothetical protein